MKLVYALWAVIICVGGAVARVPENLAGTDLFPYEGVTIEVTRNAVGEDGKVILDTDASGRRRPRQETVDVVLPLGALNLASGAEFFTVMAQQLYNFADLIEVVAKEAVPDGAGAAARDADEDDAPRGGGAGGEGRAAGGGGAAGAAAAPVREAGARGGKRVHRFITDYVTKNLAVSDAINPIAVLMRMLFNQVDGTSGLADFRVSKLAQSKAGLETTLADWAAIIAVVLAMHKVRVEKHKNQDQIAALRGLLDTENVLLNAYANFEMEQKKPAFASLIVAAMNWSDEAGFGADLVLRMLMGGVYALCGHDQTMIKYFYTQQLGKLEELKILSSESLSAVQERFAREWAADEAAGSSAAAGGAGGTRVARAVDESGGAAGAAGARIFPAPYTPEVAVDTPAYTAYKLLKNINGSFFILAHTHVVVDEVSYSDCFETMIRNIVRFFIDSQPDFKDSIHSHYADYFARYSTDVLQASELAHNDWAALVTKIPGMQHLLKHDALSPELNASLMNLLVALNFIFDLKIEEIDAFVSDRFKVSAAVLFIAPEELEIMTHKINDALTKKLGREIKITPKEFLDVDDVRIGLTIQRRLDGEKADILNGYIHVARHAEITRPPGKVLTKIDVADEVQNYFKSLVFNVNGIKVDELLPEHHFFRRDIAYSFLLHIQIDEFALADLIELPYPIDIKHMPRILFQGITQLEEFPRSMLITAFLDKPYFPKNIVVSFAKNLTKSSNVELQVSGLSLYYELVNKNLALDDAAVAVSAGLENSEASIVAAAFQLDEVLKSKARGVE